MCVCACMRVCMYACVLVGACSTAQHTFVEWKNHNVLSAKLFSLALRVHTHALTQVGSNCSIQLTGN